MRAELILPGVAVLRVYQINATFCACKTAVIREFQTSARLDNFSRLKQQGIDRKEARGKKFLPALEVSAISA